MTTSCTIIWKNRWFYDRLLFSFSLSIISARNLLSISILVLFLVYYPGATSCSNETVDEKPTYMRIVGFYRQATDNFPFVDKTAMIMEYLKSSADVLVITRPRKWGKSMNMDMLKRFLEIEVNNKGDRITEDESIHRKLFLGGTIDLNANESVKLDPLRISRSRYSMGQQGKFPVIFVDFSRIFGSTHDEIKYQLEKKMRDLYLRYNYLGKYISEENDLLTPGEKSKLNAYINKDYGLNELIDGIRFLSIVLYKHYKQKVHILIDGFDIPITGLYINLVGKLRNKSMGFAESEIFNEVFESVEFKRSVKLFQDILQNSLKDNEAVEKSLFTGVMRLSRGDILAPLNNVSEYTILDEGFSEHYGFSQDEVNDMLYTLSFASKRDDIKDWYCGYNFSGKLLYNPWSVMQCMEYNCSFDQYWLSVGHTEFVDYATLKDDTKEKLRNLSKGKSITESVDKAIHFNNGISGDLYSLLLLTGYLTPISVNYNGRNYTCELSMPNMEVKTIYMEKFSGE